MNDYAGLATALLAGVGIGDLPPVAQPELLREGRLVEIMPKWKFRNFDLSLVHAGNRHMPRVVRVFKDFAAQNGAAALSEAACLTDRDQGYCSIFGKYIPICSPSGILYTKPIFVWNEFRRGG